MLRQSRVRQFLADDSGIAITEYGLLFALIALLLIGVVALFGAAVASWFNAKTSGFFSSSPLTG
jgi:Flp pilus assembly pilin Flp